MSELFNAAEINGSIGAGSLILNDYKLTITDIEGGHRLSVERGGEVQTMDVMDGKSDGSTVIESLNEVLNSKMNVDNPTGTGSFSLNRSTAYKTGYRSFAEGHNCSAVGSFSHAEGNSTIAEAEAQHVQGRLNKRDADKKYLHVVGNGDYENGVEKRSNAHTIDWDGLGWFAGGLKVGGTGQDDEAAEEVALKSDIPKDFNVDADSLLILAETGTAESVTDENGSFLTDKSGNIFVL